MVLTTSHNSEVYLVVDNRVDLPLSEDRFVTFCRLIYDALIYTNVIIAVLLVVS